MGTVETMKCVYFKYVFETWKIKEWVWNPLDYCEENLSKIPLIMLLLYTPTLGDDEQLVWMCIQCQFKTEVPLGI